MKIFAIHSGSDHETVINLKKKIEKEANSASIFMLENGWPVIWKIDARDKINKANLILVVVGKKSSTSKYIAWEIKYAKRCNKCIAVYLLDSKNALPESLFSKDEFTDEMIEDYKVYSKKNYKDLIEYIDNDDDKYKLFNNKKYDDKLLFEQYKLFLQSSESVIQRRQSISNFYLTVNSALLGLSGAIGTLDISDILNNYIKFFIPIVGIVLCLCWIKMIKSYGALNASKLKIINIIEKKLPVSLYDTEWKVQTDRLNSRPYISFTASETRIPKIFLIIYSIILACAIAVSVKTLFSTNIISGIFKSF